MNEQWTIYCHIHIDSGRRYIGQTSQTLSKRWKNHVSASKSSRGGRWHFPNAIRKYGPEAFSHEILEVCGSLEAANTSEIKWIEHFQTRDPEKGFNLTKGGSHTPHLMTNPWERPDYVQRRGVGIPAPVSIGMKFGSLLVVDMISLRRANFICDCGRSVSFNTHRVFKGEITSCGRCGLISLSPDRKFGKLRIKQSQDVFPRSLKKIEWICDCGRSSIKEINRVTLGKVISCGKCSLIPAEEIGSKKFGKLRIKNPQDIKPKSSTPVEWLCDCGRTILSPPSEVTTGHTKTCGKCNLISQNELLSMKFGKLRIATPKDVLPGSHGKIEWVCDCGKRTLAAPYSVFGGKKVSCGRCNEIAAEQLKTMKFGKLSVKKSQNVKPTSTLKLEWVCDCGNITLKRIQYVIAGQTKSCGSCRKMDDRMSLGSLF